MPGRSARAGLIALVAAAVVAGVQLVGEEAPWERRLAGMALLLAASGALWWLGRAPVAVLGLTAAAAVAYYLFGGPPGPEPVPFVVALFGVARAGHRRVAIAAVPVATLAVVLADRLRHGSRRTRGNRATRPQRQSRRPTRQPSIRGPVRPTTTMISERRRE